MSDEDLQGGLAKLSQMRGPGAADAISAVIDGGGFGAALGALATEFAFGKVWTRPGLDAKSRSLVTIGVLAGQGRQGELLNHIEIGLNNGLTPAELEEAFLQIAAYAGLPAAWSSLRLAQELLAQREQAGN
jgi:4-carboxymuconolactone decarboxylase